MHHFTATSEPARPSDAPHPHGQGGFQQSVHSGPRSLLLLLISQPFPANKQSSSPPGQPAVSQAAEEEEEERVQIPLGHSWEGDDDFPWGGVGFITCPAAGSDENVWLSLPQLCHCRSSTWAPKFPRSHCLAVSRAQAGGSPPAAGPCSTSQPLLCLLPWA